MNTKILVVDDFDCSIWSVKQILKQHSIVETDFVNHSDDAYLKIKKGIYDNAPYNLLICDLNFKTDHRNTKLNSGEELIKAITKIQPEIKIIIFSEEVKSFRIKSLFNEYKINAFIHKGINSIIELEKAIQNIAVEESKKDFLKFEDLSLNLLVDVKEYDILILKLISNGLKLDIISKDLKKTSVNPNSESSIEKCINKLKKYFNAKNNAHLIAITKDLGLI